MSNLRGASPVGRGKGGRSYVARTVGGGISRGDSVAAQSKARERVGVAHVGQTTQARTKRMLSGKEVHNSARRSAGSRPGYRGVERLTSRDGWLFVAAGIPHGTGGSRQPAEVVGKVGMGRRGRGEVNFLLVATGQPHESLAGR